MTTQNFAVETLQGTVWTTRLERTNSRAAEAALRLLGRIWPDEQHRIRPLN